jgi:hypothetical protein
MNALSAINGYRAVDYLIPYLVLDDPQLLTALRDFGPTSFPPNDQVLNFKAVDALEKLAQAIRKRQKQDGAQALSNESYAVIGQLTHYMHPRLLPILYDWALSQDHVSSGQAFANFTSITGLKYDQADKTHWETWRAKARPFLGINYDLQTKAGRKLWMDHYAKADPATQGILMRLWFFKPTIDETALIDLAKQNDIAKGVLAELWQRNRLSGEARKTIVQSFLSVELVNQPPEESKKDRSLYGVAVIFSSSFPFPKAAWAENRRTLSIGPRAPSFQDDDWNDWSLHGKGIELLCWKDSDHALSPPQARALVELRESDLPHSHDTLWTLTWNLGPIRLTNSSP